MSLDENQLTSLVSESLQTPVQVRLTEAPVSLSNLSDGERLKLSGIRATPRAESWLRGRHALKRLLKDLGMDEDTSALTFPNTRFSISHTRTQAIAFGRTDSETNGVGVDLEIDRRPQAGTHKFFLNDDELHWLARKQSK